MSTVRLQRSLSALFFVGAVAFCVSGALVAETGRVEREGIAVEFAIEPVDGATDLREGQGVRFRFAVADTTTGQPLGGLYPAAWMVLLGEGETSDPARCVDKVEELLGGSLLSQAELDLNTYYVLALNDDATITVVDPLFGFGGTKLLAMIELPSPGEDWALTADGSTLWVSLPDSNQLAVADTLSWKVLELIEAGPRPRRVALHPDGAFLWVALDGDGEDSGVAVVNVRERRLVARVATGRGPHDLAFSDDSRFAFITNRDAGTVSVVDARSFAKLRDVATGAAPVAVSYSPLSRAAYVTDEAAGVITVVDGGSHQITTRIAAEPGLGEIRFAPGGRLGFAVNPRADVVHIIDTVRGRIVQTADLGREPDQIAFSNELAYVRHRRSEIVLMIPLDEVGEEGKSVPVVDFPGGELPLGQGRRPSLADAIVQAPGANAVLVANPSDQMIYYYKEGMAAPMGGFNNYGREPRAVLAVDGSLRELTRAGLYETVAVLPRPGRYEVAFFLDSPRIVHCFEAEVGVDPLRAAASPPLASPRSE